MRLGIVSDVHSNVEALKAALQALMGMGVDALVCVGDLVSDYQVAPEVITLARDADVLGIAGNHEKNVLLHGGSARLREQLAPDVLAYLAALPPTRELSVDGHTILVAHGAPWDAPDERRPTYVYPSDAGMLAKFAACPQSIVLLGHTHHAMACQVGGTLVVNPGSCGEARDRERRLTFTHLDLGRNTGTTYQLLQGEAPRSVLNFDIP